MFFFFQAEDGIRDLVRSRGLGDVYKRQALAKDATFQIGDVVVEAFGCELPEAFQALMAQGLSLIHI